MKPSNDALQVFYGTIPLIVVILGIWFREQLLLKDILERLKRVELKVQELTERILLSNEGNIESKTIRWNL